VERLKQMGNDLRQRLLERRTVLDWVSRGKDLAVAVIVRRVQLQLEHRKHLALGSEVA